MYFDVDTEIESDVSATGPVLRADDEAIFSTYGNDYGLIPEPRPTGEFLPSWVSDPRTRDAVQEGWLIRQPVKVLLNTEDGELHYDYTWDRTAISTHNPKQMGGFSIPISIVKFHSFWTIHLPDGYSALLTRPLNLSQELFTPFSGVVDFDVFPTVTHAPTLFEERVQTAFPAGTPLIQVIPFKRDEMLDTATVRDATSDEVAELESDADYEPVDKEPYSVSVE